MNSTKKTYPIILFCFTFTLLLCISCKKETHATLTILASLSSELDEISGITTLSDKSIYAINDSGNPSLIYRLNDKGKITGILDIPNIKNIDWEDIAYDSNDVLYIGDFGNNNHDRKDLKIYKVSGILSDHIKVSEVKFHFEDQKKFPPEKKKRNYDIEAFIKYKDNFYLFTKSKNKSHLGSTTMYKVPDTPGNHKAIKTGTYQVCEQISKYCIVTGATINKNQKQISILTHDKILILSEFEDDHFFQGKVKRIELHHRSQKEGICFANDSTLYITDEKRNGKTANLYQYILK